VRWPCFYKNRRATEEEEDGGEPPKGVKPTLLDEFRTVECTEGISPPKKIHLVAISNYYRKGYAE
jgi:hypothetical protein